MHIHFLHDCFTYLRQVRIPFLSWRCRRVLRKDTFLIVFALPETKFISAVSIIQISSIAHIHRRAIISPYLRYRCSRAIFRVFGMALPPPHACNVASPYLQCCRNETSIGAGWRLEFLTGHKCTWITQVQRRAQDTSSCSLSLLRRLANSPECEGNGVLPLIWLHFV